MQFNSSSFCERAYSQYDVQENEVALALQTPRLTISCPAEKTQLIFPRVLPKEIEELILKSLDRRSLKTCARACKQFNMIATRVVRDDKFFIVNLFTDRESLEDQINRQLAVITPQATGSFQGKPVCVLSANEQFSIQNLKLIATQISSFKAYCLFLFSHTDKHREQIKEVLRLILKLQKACQALLETKQANAPQQALVAEVNQFAQSILFPTRNDS